VPLYYLSSGLLKKFIVNTTEFFLKKVRTILNSVSQISVETSHIQK
jgi:hypothetical protein